MVHRRPTLEAGGGFVTGLARCAGDDVRAGFGDRGHALEAAAVMAGGTARGDAGVVHRRAGERGRGFMAGLATGRGRDVVAGFAQGGFTIVTCCTIVTYTLMVIFSPQETAC